MGDRGIARSGHIANMFVQIIEIETCIRRKGLMRLMRGSGAT